MATLITRALRPSAPTATSAETTFICTTCRNQSSYRRTRKALRAKPHPDFQPSTTEATDHILFNPPSSAPNVYHTPSKFLPPSDPRRKLFASPPTTSTGTSTSARHLPAVRPEYQKKYHLTPAQVDEMRALRSADPREWTRVRLAEKFECSQFFVSLCCAAPAEIREQRERDLGEIKKRWGRRKTEAREDRQIRKEGWGRDA